MAFEIYFSISKTAVELVTLAAISIAVAAAVKELTDKEDEKSEASI